MSTVAPTNALPPIDKAAESLQQISNEAYFARLSGYGIQPHTEKEAQELLSLRERVQHLAQPEKTASASRFSQVLGALDDTLGHSEAYNQHAVAQAVKVAADSYLQDPQIYNNTLAFLAAQAAS